MQESLTFSFSYIQKVLCMCVDIYDTYTHMYLTESNLYFKIPSTGCLDCNFFIPLSDPHYGVWTLES